MKLFSTERTDVYLLTLGHSTSFQRFLLNNRDNFAPFEQLRNDEYFTINSVAERISNALLDYEESASLWFSP